MKLDICDPKIEYILQLADDSLILGHRLSEWCGHGPVIEQDIAISNVSLDLIGVARQFYQYAAELQGGGATEDYFPYWRMSREYRNHVLCELDNGHWGDTIMRQFLFDTYQYLMFDALSSSKDERIAAIAAKAVKEVAYHAQYSAEWVVRLGDGTELSHNRMQDSLDLLYRYTKEFFSPSARDTWALEQGVGPDVTALRDTWHKEVSQVLKLATLVAPEDDPSVWRGKEGEHTESLDHLLSVMQSLPKTYPDAKW